jgi:hypothetical protein
MICWMIIRMERPSQIHLEYWHQQSLVNVNWTKGITRKWERGIHRNRRILLPLRISDELMRIRNDSVNQPCPLNLPHHHKKVPLLKTTLHPSPPQSLKLSILPRNQRHLQPPKQTPLKILPPIPPNEAIPHLNPPPLPPRTPTAHPTTGPKCAQI